MPPVKQCPLGAANKANIEGLDERVTGFESRFVRYMDHTDECIGELTNHYSQRPTWLVSGIITALTGLVVFLSQYIITHL